LVPDALEHAPEQARVAIFAVHEAAHVVEVHVALLELGLPEHADAARARVVVALEGEVHLRNSLPPRGGAEPGPGAVRCAGEQDALLGLHAAPLSSLVATAR